MTRDEAAASVGISRKLAAFHLDKLVAAGLLRARYAAPQGIRRVGRRPKVYEPTTTHFRISIPERRPDLLAEIMLDAVGTERPGEGARAAALRAARARGERLGAAERAGVRPGRLGPERSITVSHGMLARYGFEPYRETATRLCLLNCPFHPFAARSPALVCGINHAFLDGFLTGLEASGVEAVLAPRPGHCCVELRRARGADARPGAGATAGDRGAGGSDNTPRDTSEDASDGPSATTSGDAPGRAPGDVHGDAASCGRGGAEGPRSA